MIAYTLKKKDNKQIIFLYFCCKRFVVVLIRIWVHIRIVLLRHCKETHSGFLCNNVKLKYQYFEWHF